MTVTNYKHPVLSFDYCQQDWTFNLENLMDCSKLIRLVDNDIERLEYYITDQIFKTVNVDTKERIELLPLKVNTMKFQLELRLLSLIKTPVYINKPFIKVASPGDEGKHVFQNSFAEGVEFPMILEYGKRVDLEVHFDEQSEYIFQNSHKNFQIFVTTSIGDIFSSEVLHFPTYSN